MIFNQESSVEMAIALAFFFIIATAVFVAIAIFLPEWVGIAGSKSKEVMREQAGDKKPD